MCVNENLWGNSHLKTSPVSARAFSSPNTRKPRRSDEIEAKQCEGEDVRQHAPGARQQHSLLDWNLLELATAILPDSTL